MPKPHRNKQNKIVIIAGPNGAGKTTFAVSFLPHEGECPEFINADLIAGGLSPFAPEKAAMQAGRIMLRQIADRVNHNQSFAFETTLSGLSYARRIPEWQRLGYRVKLIFLSLPSAEIAIRRVQSRVRQGGHSVPEPIIRRRFDAGLKNFNTIYCNLVNNWVFYDNVGVIPRFVREGKKR